MKKNMQICWVSNMQTFTVKIYSTFLFALLSQLALAQFQDDFSDNDFSSSPAWSGTDALFTVADARLLLNGGEQDSVAYLSTASHISNQATWEFAFALGFNPSAANHARVYLMADQHDLTGSLNGYFVMLGASKDAISLYRQTGITHLEVIKGREDRLNLTSVEASVKVTRDNNGWKLYTRDADRTEYTLEGSFDDDTDVHSSYFGVVCIYTSTRSDKFAFDNFDVSGVVATDTVPPSLRGIEVVSSNEIKLTFSEPLDKAGATDVSNYLMDGSHNPTEALLVEDHTVSLVFAEPLAQGAHSITISGLTDLHENSMGVLQQEFVYLATVNAVAKDVIITEIFPDPSPSAGLPESEFVEIYNRSDKTFDLKGWIFTDGSSTAVLPTYILPPRTYIVLAPENLTNHFEHGLFLKGFPSLNNTGDALLLRDKNLVLIDSVRYAQEWFGDVDKEDGGWTLEIIDPENLCSERENWSASEDERGGTPGNANSILASKPDIIGPKLVSAFPDDSVTLFLRFNEKLEATLSDIDIKLDPAIGIEKVTFSDVALTGVEVSTSSEFERGVIYTVTINNIKDCSGNMIQDESRFAAFGMPEDADSSDVLINEILFNPRPTGVDFVEILNNTTKFINLRGWSIGNRDSDEISMLTDTDLILAPGEHLAITSNPRALKGEYIQSDEEDFLALRDLPSFNDDSGSVVLLDDRGNVIDYVIYSKEFHSVFIKDDEGVSLERISDSSSGEPQNWRSASGSVGFATPGYLNSNTVDVESVEATLTVDPEIFNPLSGHPGFALIHYNFERGGYVANVKIFDSQGRSIKELANNDILGTKGFYRWDGDRDDGSKAALGPYMIWFEVYNDEGTVKRYRRRIAVASTFK